MKSHFLKRKPPSQEMALQITSMADIFMILLVFLLKSYATSVSTLTSSSGITLPSSRAGSASKETLKLEVSASSISVDDKVVLGLSNFNFAPQEIPPPGLGRSETLYRSLLEKRRRMPQANLDPNLLLFVDRKAPYSTLQSVLASAASAGFVDLQLVVIHEE